MTKRNGRTSYKGIPAEHRERVARIRVLRGDSGEHMTPQAVYRDLVAGWKMQVADKRKKEVEERRDVERRRSEALKEAKGAFGPAIADLADTRDLIEMLAKGDAGGFCQESFARFAGLSLCDAAARIEQALCDLGLIEEDNHGGYFHSHQNELKRQVPAIPNERRA
jgi:hypothetical protein